MKKIISLVLLMSFIMSSLLTFPVKAADKKDVKTDERIETLTGIGLIDYTDDVIDLPITRAEFADIMATILGFQEQIRLEAWYQYFLGEDKNDDLTEKHLQMSETGIGHIRQLKSLPIRVTYPETERADLSPTGA